MKTYVGEHFGSSTYDKIEWIDDTSLNLVFASESLAQGAITAISRAEILDPSQLPPLESIPAKPYSGKPDSVLYIRFAAQSDKKVAGAAQRSRFYLLHPEYDPEERRRRGEIRGRYRDREGYGRRNERERYNGRQKENRIDDYDVDSFDVNLYDDDSSSLAKRITKPRSRHDSPKRYGRLSPGTDEERDYARNNREKELFPNLKSRDRNGGSRRDRSASPRRDDTRMEVDDLARDREAAVQNRERARVVKERLAKENKEKELFPSKVSSSAGGKAQMDRVDTRTVLPSGMSRLSLYDSRYWW